MLGVLMRKDVTGHPKRLAMPTLNVNYVPVVECKLTYQVSNYYNYAGVQHNYSIRMLLHTCRL